ncbi:peptide-N-glycosidase F-related protein [Polluticoccus soli]|uniref:peptide-N-glycosidase F-related protein n=1 Tax=Polluticoccus soli TaxID=3034150 RepID=UPI0023E23241|nr:peptide-N-glycosidase F-related protein [Flavipsychrobacter sp. JY13-12]
MKRIVYLFLLAFLPCVVAKAAPGDTTWVQGQTDAWLGTVPTNTDSLLTFPDGSKSYRKIYMIFTLGKYACPGTPQYCADWDYTVQNFLMTPNGDTLELGRLITPYANSSRLNANWKGRYVYDVTDMYPVLKNNATVRIHFSGWSGGFTGTVQFAFIEGTRPRDVLGVERLWHGSFTYGDGANPIDTKVTTFSKAAPAGAASTEMKLNITGHGGDATSNCSEFCKKYYQVKVNGNMTEQKDIWREDCGVNEIYPQNGTWVFNRGNWCPGSLVRTNVHNLNVAGGNNYDVDIDFEAYTGSGSLGSYTTEAAVYYYGGFNKQLDASLEDIIAPSKDEMHFRSNPYTARPIVKVKNEGSTTITSIEFTYGNVVTTYTWQGSIAPLAEAEITLPEVWDLRSATGTTNTFTCQITKVNGQTDADQTNDKMSSTYAAAPMWPTSFYVTLKTNGSVGSNGSETSWKIYHQGNVVAQRVNTNTSTTYVDTVKLGPGAYMLEVTDEGCDGVNWWLYSSYPQNPGIGSINVKRSNGNGSLAMNGYFNGDFGCGFKQYFNVDWPTAVDEVVSGSNLAISVHPNPAQNKATVSFEGVEDINGQVMIVDAVGRVIAVQTANAAMVDINTAELANGVYSVIYSATKTDLKLQTRLVIAK